MRLAYRLVHASRFGKPETAGVFKLVSFFPCQGSILPLDFYRTLSGKIPKIKMPKVRDICHLQLSLNLLMLSSNKYHKLLLD